MDWLGRPLTASRASDARRSRSRWARCCLAAVAAALPAAAPQQWVTLRSVPRNPLGDELQLTSSAARSPAARTMQLLRVYNLTDDLQGDLRPLLEKLQQITPSASPRPTRSMPWRSWPTWRAARPDAHNPDMALDLYGASVLHAYDYLFDDRLAATAERLRSAVPRRLRPVQQLAGGGAADRLQAARADSRHDQDDPHGGRQLGHHLRAARRRWRPEEFDRFEFVSDYEMNGLKNLYQTHGLGVPLIAVRRSYPGEPAAARYYPPDLSFPVTALAAAGAQRRSGRATPPGAPGTLRPAGDHDTWSARRGCRWKAT